MKQKLFILIYSALICLSFTYQSQSRSPQQNAPSTQTSKSSKKDSTLTSSLEQRWKKTRSEKIPYGPDRLQEFAWSQYRILAHSDEDLVDFAIYYKSPSTETKNTEQRILHIVSEDNPRLIFFSIIDSIFDLQKNGKIDLVACTYSDGNIAFAHNFFIELDQGKAKVFARIISHGCLEKGTEIVDINGDGLFELVLTNFLYDNTFSGDWEGKDTFTIPAPELIFQWDPKKEQYLLAQDLIRQRVPNAQQLTKLAKENRQSRSWKHNEVPSAVFQTTLALMYAGKEKQAWKFFRDSIPRHSPVFSKAKKALRSLRDRDSYWQALQNKKPASLELYRF